MATFFFHLRDGIDQLLDPEGTTCTDLEAVKAKTLTNARDIITGDVFNGLVDLHYRIDVEDQSGTIVHTLQFEDAVTIRRGESIEVS